MATKHRQGPQGPEGHRGCSRWATPSNPDEASKPPAHHTAPCSPHRPPHVSTAYPERPELGRSGLRWDPAPPPAWPPPPPPQKGRQTLWSKMGRRVSCLLGSSVSQEAFPGQHPGHRVSAAEALIADFPLSPACPEVTLLWQEVGRTGSRSHVSTTLPPCAPAPGGRNPLLGNPAPHSPCPSPGQARGLGHICAHPQGPHRGPVPPRRPHECTRPLGCSLPLPTLRTAGLRPACPLSTHREGEGPVGEKADVRPPRVLRSSLARPEPGWSGHGGQVPKGPLSTHVLVACAATLLSNPLLGNQGGAGRSPPPQSTRSSWNSRNVHLALPPPLSL